MKNLINLERFKQSLINDFCKTLKSVDDYLQKAVFNREVKSLSNREIKQILTNADKELQSLFTAYMDGLKTNWRGLFHYRYQKQSEDAYTRFKKKLNSPKSLTAYADKVFAKPLNLTANVGVTLDELTKSFSKNESERLIRAIGFAHTDGLTNDKLIQMIRGSKANHFKDGILSTTSRNAQTIARTGTAIMASEAKQEFINQNRDIIKGIRVNATLDRRTSPICRHLDHQFMPIEQAKYPPYHFNCRSGFEIVFDGYESPKHGASEFGVTENVSYYEWLKNQDKAYIQSVLGKKKAQTFLSDGMTADKFKQLGLDRSFEPLPLNEILKLSDNDQLLHDWVGSKSVINSFHKALENYANPYNLTFAEYASIRHYTGVGSADLNDYLNGFAKFDDKKSAILQNASNLLVQALDKLPNYQGIAIRRIESHKIDLSKFQVGLIVNFSAFSSSTYGNDDVFSHRKIRLKIRSKTGKKIDDIAINPDEKEILFSKDTQFFVANVEYRRYDIEITLQEID